MTGQTNPTLLDSLLSAADLSEQEMQTVRSDDASAVVVLTGRRLDLILSFIEQRERAAEARGFVRAKEMAADRLLEHARKCGVAAQEGHAKKASFYADEISSLTDPEA